MNVKSSKDLGQSGLFRTVLCSSLLEARDRNHLYKVLVSPRKRLGKNDLNLFCFTYVVSAFQMKCQLQSSSFDTVVSEQIVYDHHHHKVLCSFFFFPSVINGFWQTAVCQNRYLYDREMSK